MATAWSPHVVARRCTYDVFVSFRGQDIRKGFMDHLFSDFMRKGIRAFKDDETLKRGEFISPELEKAIEQSRFLIVVFSKNYASSVWCLRELVKILECKDMDKGKYEVRPIFYDVKPSVVRDQTESYAKDMEDHEVSNSTEVPKWRQALTMAANLSGWDLQDSTNGYESKFIDMITKDIFYILSRGPLHVGENLVGLHSRAEEMNLTQFLGSNEKVHMIGVCGAGGVGKTTISRAIYNLLHVHFEGSSFCEDVKGASKREGLVYLQKRLIKDITRAGELNIGSKGEGKALIKRIMEFRKVLVVLDDVDHREQLDNLAGNPDWFGPGSMIVIVGRDKQLLRAYGVEIFYKVDYLTELEAFELLSLYAFRNEQPQEDFIQLAKRIVHYVRGHPLALKVLGSLLFSKTLRVWESQLDKLKQVPNNEIHEVLKLSYDGLDDPQKNVFLDIACFFAGEMISFVTKILDACDCFPDIGIDCFAVDSIEALCDKSLIVVENDKLMMHDLIQQMGREIVRKESKDPGKRSRLWFLKDVLYVLNNKKGTEAVRGLVLDLSSKEVNVDCKTFENMNNLRLLKLSYSESFKPFELINRVDYEQLRHEGCKFDLSGGFVFLCNELRCLQWHGYPLESLPSAFYSESLVSLDMSYSNIKQLPTGWKGLQRLAFLNLSHCLNLTRTPVFTEIPNLEQLILDKCINLLEVDRSIGVLENLKFLDLRNCKSLRSFPSIKFKNLETLLLSGCSNVDKLLECFGERNNSILELDAKGPGSNQLPSSSDILQVLRRYEEAPSSLIRAREHPVASGLLSLPSLRLLTFLDLERCNISGATLSVVGCLSSLEVLNLNGTDIIRLPAEFSKLSRLQCLNLVGCMNLQALPELPPNLLALNALSCTSLQELPQLILQLIRHGGHFDFFGCPQLEQHQGCELVLRLLLQELHIGEIKSEFSIMLSDFRIPAWFNIRSMGECRTVAWFNIRSMGECRTVKLPKQRHSHKIKAIASCVVLHVKIMTPLWIKMKVSNIHDLCRNSVSYDIFLRPSYAPSGYNLKTWLAYIDLSSRGLNWKASDCIEVSYDLGKFDPSGGDWCTSGPEDMEIIACGLRRIYEEREVKDVIVPEIHRESPFNAVDRGGVDMPRQSNYHNIKAICFGVVLSVKLDPRIIDTHFSMSTDIARYHHRGSFTVTEFLTSIDGLDDTVDQLLVVYIDLSSSGWSNKKICIEVPYEMRKTSQLADVQYVLGEDEAIFKKCVKRRIYHENDGVNPIDYGGSIFNLLLPGSRVPGWFNIQRMGDGRRCLKLELPPRWEADKIKAIACCVVFNVKVLDSNLLSAIFMTISNSDDLRGDDLHACANLTLVDESDCFDQTWLVHIDMSEGCNWKGSDHLKVSYEIRSFSYLSGELVPHDGGEIKVCGVRMICDEEDDEVEANLLPKRKKQKTRAEECSTSTAPS